VGSPAGSGSDVMMRAVAQKMTERLGQSIVVDNRPGATGAISLQVAAQGIPDGYTLATLSAQNVTAMVFGTVKMNIQRELMAVVLMISQPYLLVATPSLPGDLGEGADCAGEGEAARLRFQWHRLRRAPRDGALQVHGGRGHDARAVQGQRALHDRRHERRVQLAITNVLTATPLVRGGKLKALAITSDGAWRRFASCRRSRRRACPATSCGAGTGSCAQPTPAALVAYLNREVAETMNAPR
jgi:hypothetical protein